MTSLTSKEASKVQKLIKVDFQIFKIPKTKLNGEIYDKSSVFYLI